MSRVYSVQFNDVAVTVAQDLFELVPADDKPVRLLGAVITCKETETNEQFTCTVQRRTGAFTSGSGGSTPTAIKRSSSDAAAGFAVEANNTTRITSGAAEVYHVEGWPSQGGFAYWPLPGTEITVTQVEALVVGLEVAPAASTKFNGVIYVEELG